MANYTLVSLQLGKYSAVLPSAYYVLLSTGSYKKVSALTQADSLAVTLPGASTPFGQLGRVDLAWEAEQLTPLDTFAFAASSTIRLKSLSLKTALTDASPVYVDVTVTPSQSAGQPHADPSVPLHSG